MTEKSNKRPRKGFLLWIAGNTFYPLTVAEDDWGIDEDIKAAILRILPLSLFIIDIPSCYSRIVSSFLLILLSSAIQQLRPCVGVSLKSLEFKSKRKSMRIIIIIIIKFKIKFTIHSAHKKLTFF